MQIIAKKPIGSAPKRLQRMFLRMRRYEYTIGYWPGKELLIADTLSRAHPTCNGQPCDFEEVAQTSFERTLEQINAVEDVGISSSLVEQLRAETALDTQMGDPDQIHSLWVAGQEVTGFPRSEKLL